jgi:alpha-mannosidase
MMAHRRLHLVGNAHLDPAWLWRWQEGFAEIKATFRSALDRLEEFPEATFTSACAAYYQWVEQNEPGMFEEIRQRVREGRWTLAGGMWIQPDCNAPSGESFAHHGLYSQRYFLQRFGTIAKTGYNVDSFGHCGTLPQILRQCGMARYVFMRPDDRENPEVPARLFWWESRDGSRVMAFRIPFSYTQFRVVEGRNVLDERALDEVLRMADAQGTDLLFLYGVGNHGGGPTIASLRELRRLQGIHGCDVLVHGSPDRYFDEAMKAGYDLPVHRNDLQHHASGCYSAHSETKASNRKAEHRLATAEKFSTLAHGLCRAAYPRERLETAWKDVLFNQFHDILGGCSIREVYDDARESYGEALHIGAEVLNAAVQKIAWSIDTSAGKTVLHDKALGWKPWETEESGAPLVVFNPLPWEVTAPVVVPMATKGISDEQGHPLETQAVRASFTNAADKWGTLFLGELPAMGYRVFWLHGFRAMAPPGVLRDPIRADALSLENDDVRLEIDGRTGHIRSLFDRRNGVEVLQGAGAVPIVIDEEDSDTWAHGIFSFRREVGRFGEASVTRIETGPLRAVLRVISRFGDSTLQQDFTIRKDRPDIEVKVKLDWRERHRLLKLSFPVNVTDPTATYEIPFGSIERPVLGTEEPGHQWLDVGGRACGRASLSYGLALLNDSKYSFDVKGGDLRMTVVRSPIFADHYGERDDLCEFMDQGIQEFRYALVPHAGDWRTAGIVRRANELNVSPIQVLETFHEGALPLAFSGLRVSDERILATAFKRAEDGEGTILRCYETTGCAVQVRIAVPASGRDFEATFGPFGIRTWFLPDQPEAPVEERNLLEMGVESSCTGACDVVYNDAKGET